MYRKILIATDGSSHGRRGISKMLLGSIASEVLSLSPIPVLVVKPAGD